MARTLNVKILGDSSSLERSFRRSSAAGNAFGRDIGRASRGVLAVSAGYRSLARSVAFAGASFVGAAGITAGLKASISGFTQFQDALQQTVGLAGVAQDKIAGFGKQILQLAPVVGKSPQELAKAFYFVASSGIAASKAMSVVTSAAKDSAAGLGETQTVADAITSAMNAYGVANLSAAKASDVLVATVREGKGEADQFAGVIGNVAALASQLGVSFNDVGAALAAQTRLGIDAETAATQLQRVFSTLVKVTPQSAKAFKAVGLNADTLRKQLGDKGLLFVLKEVRRAFAGRLPDLAKAFGDLRAVRGVLALVGNQAGATATIFDHLRKAAGSAKTAFDAVSKDTAQRFRQLRASAEVAGISIGALFAPLAGKVAKSLASAATQFSGFVDKITAEQTITGRLNVIWEGVSGAAKGAESALADAVARIDWNAVWSKANGIADGLQQRLEAVDWGKVGAAIGEGIADAVSKAASATKQIAQRITDVIGSIDFVALGRKAGPGLAAALVSAFATLTDPAFWAKNWDLALAVGLTVFGGSVGRVFGRLGELLARPFARAGEDAALALASGIERGSSRVAGVVLDLALGIPRVIGSALSRLERVVSRRFFRLGSIARFTVKVLGIQAAIDAVVGLVRRIREFASHVFTFKVNLDLPKLPSFSIRPLEFAARLTGIPQVVGAVKGLAGHVRGILGGVGDVITGNLSGAFHSLERLAIRSVLKIIEPFTHLPGFLGGGPFRRMKEALQGQLDGMVAASQKAAADISTALSGVTSVVPTGADRHGPAASRAQAAAAPRRPPTTTTTKTTTPQTTAAATAAATTVDKAFVLPFRLRLAQARAEATRQVSDDLKVAREVRAFILHAIPHLHGDKLLGAYQALGQATDTITNAATAAADKAKAASDKLKGFTVPLGLQVAQARLEALGKPFVDILKKIRATAQKAIKSGRLGLQGQLDAWNTIININEQLKNGAQGAETAFKKVDTSKLADAFNLTGLDKKRFRAAVSQIGAGGTVPTGSRFALAGGTGGTFVVESKLILDGRQVATNTTRHQQKRAARNPGQRRGPHAGQ